MIPGVIGIKRRNNMKHTNNLGRRLTDIKVSILKLMIDNLDAPITVKAFKIKHKDLFDELVRLEKLLEEKNKMKYKETEDDLNWCQQTTKISSSLPMQRLHQLIAYMTQELVRLTELNDKYESYLKEKENGE